MNPLTAAIGYHSGKWFARYCLWAIGASRVHFEGEANIPDGPAILVNWHMENVLGLGLHYHYLYRLPAIAFAPPGFIGIAARGKVEGFGIQVVHLPPGAAGNPVGTLKHMLRALAGGKLIVMSVDGPSGPFHQVRPGVAWLARSSGCPLIPIGAAARPALPWLRWDHQLTPLPGSKIALVFGRPIHLERGQEIDDRLLAELGAAIEQVTQQAREFVNASSRRQVFYTPASFPRRSRRDRA